MPFIPLHDDTPRVLIRHAWVTWGLIAACVLVFFIQASLPGEEGQRLIYGLGVIPASLTGEGQLHPELVLVPPAATVLTSLFLHGSILHLIGNMLYLWVFGDNIEDSMGHGRFLAFYLVCGTLAALVHVAVDPGARVPTIGASGAISGILGAYLVLHPTARILVPIWIIPVYLPAYILLVLWIGFQVMFAATGGPAGGGVAWWAHIGGFVAGAVLIVPFRHKAIPLLGARPPQGLRLRRGPRRRRDEGDDGDSGRWG